MKRHLRLVLLLGALLGLFGQGIALAHIPSPAVTQTMPISSDDCMQMMAQADHQKPGTPCKGMTLDCIAAMGCAVPVVLAEPSALPATLPMLVPAPPIAASRPLPARVVAPEPEPPTLI